MQVLKCNQGLRINPITKVQPGKITERLLGRRNVRVKSVTDLHARYCTAFFKGIKTETHAAASSDGRFLFLLGFLSRNPNLYRRRPTWSRS